MPWTFDPDTREINLPTGDTLDMEITITGGSYDAAIFAIYDSDGHDLLRVPVDIVDGKVSIRLTNQHTRDLAPGRYKWNLRLVSDAVRDDEGNIIVDDPSDNVLTVFGPGRANTPTIRLTKDGAFV